MDVSVIIAAYNAMPYVVPCVQSVLSQTLGRDRVEIVVVDDGSTDGTSEALDSLAADEPSMRVVHQANSGGPAGPRNRAIDMSTGRYVFILDADDRLGEEALERMVRVADEQGTDVVLGRQVGVGGRKVARRPFDHTVLRTSVFESRAFNTLSPMKMYRRTLLDSIGLRFPEDLLMGEDQPFAAHAYFNASAISILGDYDYIYMTNRADGQNMTLTHTHADANVESITRVFEILEHYVLPGAARDAFAARLFLIEVMDSTLARLPGEHDPAAQHRVLEAARSWVKRWYTPGVSELLPWPHRICFESVTHGSDSEILAVLRAMASRADFMLLHRLDALSWSKGVLTVSGCAGLSGLTVPQAIDVILASRDGATSFRVRAQVPVHDETGIAAFEATVSPRYGAGGARLPEGVWDAFIEVSHHGLSQRDAYGATRVEPFAPGPFSAKVELPVWSYFRATAGFDEQTSTLTLVTEAPITGLPILAKRIRRRLKQMRRKLHL